MAMLLVHKVLTYTEYRAVSGVFKTIDPPPPLHPASVSSLRTKSGGGTLRAVRGAGGQYFGRRQTLDWPLTVYNTSTFTFIKSSLVGQFCCCCCSGGGLLSMLTVEEVDGTTLWPCLQSRLWLGDSVVVVAVAVAC
jgi:hypothetical protein